MTGPLLLALFGVWLLAQTVAGGLPARLLSRRQSAAGETSRELLTAATGGNFGTVSGGTVTDASPVTDRPDLATWRGATLSKAVMPAYQRMVSAAASEGVDLHPLGAASTFRTREQQIQLRRDNGCPDILTSPPGACRVATAIPGTSKHERGEAIDFAGASSYSGPVYNWLRANAGRHGFANTVDGEAWHWSWGGG